MERSFARRFPNFSIIMSARRMWGHGDSSATRGKREVFSRSDGNLPRDGLRYQSLGRETSSQDGRKAIELRTRENIRDDLIGEEDGGSKS